MASIHTSPRMLNRALQLLALLVVLLLVMLLGNVIANRQAKAEPALDGVYLMNIERGWASKAPVYAAQDSAVALAEIQPVHERDRDSRWRNVMDEHRIISACRTDTMLSR